MPVSALALDHSGTSGNVDWLLYEQTLSLIGKVDGGGYTDSYNTDTAPFKGNDEIQHIEITNVSRIGDRLFLSCPVKDVTFNDNVLKEIREDAFRNSGLTEVYLPEVLTRIGTKAFYASKLTAAVFLFLFYLMINLPYRRCGRLRFR